MAKEPGKIENPDPEPEPKLDPEPQPEFEPKLENQEIALERQLSIGQNQGLGDQESSDFEILKPIENTPEIKRQISSSSTGRPRISLERQLSKGQKSRPQNLTFDPKRVLINFSRG